jgi:hypothetical protein
VVIVLPTKRAPIAFWAAHCMVGRREEKKFLSLGQSKDVEIIPKSERRTATDSDLSAIQVYFQAAFLGYDALLGTIPFL